MNRPNRSVTHIDMGTLKLEIHPNRKVAGTAAAIATAEEILRLGRLGKRIGVIFTTGAAQSLWYLH